MTHILLIDEDTALLSSLAPQLELAGFTTSRTSTLRDGLQRYQEIQPDMVLLDIGTQRGEGWHVLDELVALGARVMVLSRQRSAAEIARGLSAGATDYLTKPYHFEELLARLTTRLQQPAPQSIESRSLPPQPASLAAPITSESLREPAVAAPAPSLSLGERLREARKQRNISLVQANLETKIQMYYIQALEEDKYALLPRGAASDAIVRTYASYLNADPDEALAEYHTHRTVEPEAPRDLAGRPMPRRRVPLWISLLVVALLSCGLSLGALRYFFPQQTTNTWHNMQALWRAPTTTPTPTTQPTNTLAPAPQPTTQPSPTVAPTLTPAPTATISAAPSVVSVPLTSSVPLTTTLPLSPAP